MTTKSALTLGAVSSYACAYENLMAVTVDRATSFYNQKRECLAAIYDPRSWRRGIYQSRVVPWRRPHAEEKAQMSID